MLRARFKTPSLSESQMPSKDITDTLIFSYCEAEKNSSVRRQCGVEENTAAPNVDWGDDGETSCEDGFLKKKKCVFILIC